MSTFYKHMCVRFYHAHTYTYREQEWPASLLCNILYALGHGCTRLYKVVVAFVALLQWFGRALSPNLSLGEVRCRTFSVNQKTPQKEALKPPGPIEMACCRAKTPAALALPVNPTAASPNTSETGPSSAYWSNKDKKRREKNETCNHSILMNSPSMFAGPGPR